MYEYENVITPTDGSVHFATSATLYVRTCVKHEKSLHDTRHDNSLKLQVSRGVYRYHCGLEYLSILRSISSFHDMS
jgi:hypothetical protein